MYRILLALLACNSQLTVFVCDFIVAYSCTVLYEIQRSEAKTCIFSDYQRNNLVYPTTFYVYMYIRQQDFYRTRNYSGT